MAGMRILLTANASYVPPRGGATRSNLLWIEELAAAGHDCRIVCAALEDAPSKRRQMEEERLETAWTRVPAGPGLETFERGRIGICGVLDRSRMVPVLEQQARDFRPDWLLVSSEDVGHVLMLEAHRAAPGRVVYLAHTPQFFPFGPESWNPDAHAAELARKCAGIVAIGHHMAAYIRRHTGRDAALVHPPVYGEGPFEDLARFDRGAIAMINPCAVKGVSIFLALAARLPALPFAALPGWGTTAADMAGLRALPNVELLPNVRDMRELFARTRVLLMPSLWYEGFGLIVMQAMLHGIPVIASDSGGLVEAKSGTGFVIPAPHVERYEPEFDERAMPRPVVGRVDVEPWAEAIQTLTSDGEAYRRESAASRRAAADFLAGLRPGAMEAFLQSLAPAEPAGAAEAAPPVEHLSPEKRTLLLQMLRKKGLH